MSDEIVLLLWVAAITVPVGIAIGITLRRLRPEWCKRCAKWCYGPRWKLFAFSAALLGALGALSFVQGRAYFGAFYLAFCGLELFALFRYGFRTLSPEMEKRIDESDPTRLWPLSWWKKGKSG